MLKAVPTRAATADAVWIDLIDATEVERAGVMAATGLRIPTREELSEVENSSRLYIEGGAIYLSTPVAFRGGGNDTVVSPVGFVLEGNRLLTIRFAPLIAFETVHGRLDEPAHASSPDALGTLIMLFEAMVDRLADVLEVAGARLDTVSANVFTDGVNRTKGARSMNAALREALSEIGRLGDQLSRIRDSLQGLARIVPFLEYARQNDAGPALLSRLETVRVDIASLRDFDQQLASKVSFLLDATLGFIGMQQNDIFRLLTIVSIVGIPPTLVAGIYGMNFKNMPEYDWAWGYPYAWALLILSAVAPLILFRVKGWL
jgi:magnesium transporter